MELAVIRDRFPAFDGLLVQLNSLISRRRVVLAADDHALSLSWRDRDEQRLVHADLPPDLCRRGVPLQRQALAETVADLLLEQNIAPVSVELELLLPLPSCHWRLLEGASGLDDASNLRELSPEMNWPLQWHDSYLAMTPMDERGMAMVVGADRLMLQAWIDTVALADISLYQAEWLLVAAWRALQVCIEPWQGEWVWVIEQNGMWRLVVLCDGWPELDVALQSTQVMSLREEVLLLLEAWDGRRRQVDGSRSWWITAGPSWKGCWATGHATDLHGPLVSDGEMSLLQLALKAPSDHRG